MPRALIQHILALTISLALNATVQLTSRRLLGARISVFRSALLGFFFGALTLVILRAALHFTDESSIADPVMLLGDFLIYVGAGYCWLHYVNIGEASVRLRLAYEILDAEPLGLTPEELAQRYGIRQIIDLRLSRLVAADELIPREGRYYLARPKMLVVARVFACMRRIVLDDSYPAIQAMQAAEQLGRNDADATGTTFSSNM